MLLMCLPFIVLAAITLIPSVSASKENYIGYYSFCSFVPFSTIILLVIAYLFFRFSKIG
jgi:hypothetical protein